MKSTVRQLPRYYAYLLAWPTAMPRKGVSAGLAEFICLSDNYAKPKTISY